MRDPLLISERLYSVLLSLYPKPFRAVYGAQMRLTFRDACRVAYRRHGRRGLFALWLPTLLDLFKSVVEVWARQGEFIMLKSRLMAVAGPLTLLVGVMWMVVALCEYVLFAGWVGEEMFAAFWSLVFALSLFFSFIPLLFALIGTVLRFYPSVAMPGRVGLALSVVGCAGLVIALSISIMVGGSLPNVAQGMWVNYAAVVCLLSIRIGYILFGIDVWRYRILPRWNLMPLLLGLTVLLSLPMDWFGVPALLPSAQALPPLHFPISGVCWILLGVAIMEQHREPQPAAVA